MDFVDANVWLYALIRRQDAAKRPGGVAPGFDVRDQ